jgi:hypothetical protein
MVAAVESVRWGLSRCSVWSRTDDFKVYGGRGGREQKMKGTDAFAIERRACLIETAANGICEATEING